MVKECVHVNIPEMMFIIPKEGKMLYVENYGFKKMKIR